eukprot:1754031-Pleurochrysis_carterae.AAC.1
MREGHQRRCRAPGWYWILVGVRRGGVHLRVALTAQAGGRGMRNAHGWDGEKWTVRTGRMGEGGAEMCNWDQ